MEPVSYHRSSRFLSKSLESHLHFVPPLEDLRLVSPVHFQTKEQT